MALFRTTPEQNIEICEKYKSGQTLEKLGNDYSVNPVTIRNILLKNDVELRRSGGPDRVFTETEISTIFERWKNGESLNKIADDLSYSRASLMNLLKRHGYRYETRHPMSGESHHSWKGGRVKAGKYIAVRPDIDDSIGLSMIRSNGYVAEHKLVMAHYLNRPLTEYETVHHINGDTTDNRIENLQLRIGNHGKAQAYCCQDCGSDRIGPKVL